MEVSQYTEAISIVVCLALVTGMMVAFIIGRRGGVRHRRIDPEGARTVSGAVEAAIYALLGLLIAFTFSGAADRFDARRGLIAQEANAIDTAYLEIDLLDQADQPGLRDDFRAYLDARLAFYRALNDRAIAQTERQRTDGFEAKLWTHAIAAMPRGQAHGALVLTDSITRMFEVARERELAMLMHPPLAIYALLISLALICASLAGHHSSAGERHPWVLPLTFAVTLGLSIYVILDLEYPRAGLIRIDAADVLLREVRAKMQ